MKNHTANQRKISFKCWNLLSLLKNWVFIISEELRYEEKGTKTKEPLCFLNKFTQIKAYFASNLSKIKGLTQQFKRN